MQTELKVFKNLKRFSNSIRTCYRAVKRPVLSELKDKELPQNQKESNIPLATRLWSKIKATGPITVAEYMRESLTNPETGYYMHRDVFGQKGDFITSPEISQMFGEIIAIWILNECKNVRAPPIIQIVELGPGRGTLAKDLLRVFHHFGYSNKISLHLVEVSPFLTATQSRTLCLHSSVAPSNSKHSRSGETVNSVPVFWYPDVKDVPKKFSIFLAHEFFDALPVHKLQKTPQGLREMLVDIDVNKPNHFRYVLANNDTPATKLHKYPLEDNRDHIEISPQGNMIIDHLASRIEEDGGMVLIADYGHNGEKGDTFRSFKKNKLHDPLVEPGTADLTADVDFSQMKRIAESNERCVTFGPVTQRDFLKRMGIDVRLRMLLKQAPTKNAEELTRGYSMIVDKDQMGERFKFFCMFPFVLKHQFKESPVCGFV